MKRFLGFVLALSMIIAMIPAVAAEETGTGLTIRYAIQDTMKELGMVEGATNKPLSLLTYENTNGFFEFLEMYDWNTATLGEIEESKAVHGYNGDQIKYTKSGILNMYRKRIAFKVYIPYPGTYTMKMYNSDYYKVDSKTNDNADYMYVNVDKTDIACSDTVNIGGYSCLDDEVSSWEDAITTPNVVTDKIVVDEPGEYIVSFYCYKRGTIGNFELVQEKVNIDEKLLMKPVLTISGGKAQVTGLWDSDGAAVSLDGAEITYASSNHEVATIDASTGVITDKAVGTTDITATVTVNGATITATEKYTVTDGVTIKYAVQDTMKTLGMTIKYNDRTDPEIVASKPHLSALNYENTNGFFEFFEAYNHISGSEGKIEDATATYDQILYTESGLLNIYRKHIAFKIYVPRAGKYTMKMYNSERTGDNASVMLVNIDKTKAECSDTINIGSYDCSKGTGTSWETAITIPNVITDGIVIDEPGEYIVTFYNWKRGTIGNFELVDGIGTMVVPMSVKLGDVTDGTAEISKVVMSDGTTTADGATVTYTSSNTDVATINEKTGAITPLANGTTGITVSVEHDGVTVTDTVEYTVTDKKAPVTPEIDESENNVTFAAVANIPNAVITTNPVLTDEITSVQRGTEVIVKAPAEVGNYVFRHWVRGSADFGTYVCSTPEYKFNIATNTYLTAVYTEKATGKTVEFFNQNGEYITEKAVNESGIIETLPTATLTGYIFDKWLLDENVEFTNSAAQLTSQITRVVARFKDNENVKFNVNDDYKMYGEKIALTQPGAKYWMRNGEVVGYGESYTHFVWDNAEITYSTDEIEKTPLVVLDGTAKDGARMIEYNSAGYEIVEVGILFGDNANITVESCNSKATSQTKGEHIEGHVGFGQFTAKPAEKESVARGYMIYKVGDDFMVVYSK